MKLLILTNNPSRASFRLRVVDHLDDLAQQGIQAEIHAMPRRMADRWRLFKTAGHYDAVLLHRKCLNFWDAAVFAKYKPITFFDFDDAIMHSTSRPGSRYTSHYRLFRRTAKMMDVIIAGNENLAEYARRYCKQVVVLPTGLDVMSYQRTNIQKDTDHIRIVWIGSESTLKFLADLKPVLEEIGKAYKNVSLRIIADTFFDLTNMKVEKYPWSLQNQVSDLLSCDIGLAPLPDDPFTRGKCGFKILQYFAAGLPVIASPVGVNETFIKESNAGLLASTPGQWKEAIEKMIKDIVIYRQFGDNGKRFVQGFDKILIGKQLCRILKTAVSL